MTSNLTRYQPETAPKIGVYKNGTDDPISFVVNKREVPTFDCLLNRLSEKLKIPVRSLKTPVNGHAVEKLDQIEKGKYYVALGGYGAFRGIG